MRRRYLKRLLILTIGDQSEESLPNLDPEIANNAQFGVATDAFTGDEFHVHCSKGRKVDRGTLIIQKRRDLVELELESCDNA